MNSLVNFPDILSTKGGRGRSGVVHPRRWLAALAMLSSLHAALAAEPEPGSVAPLPLASPPASSTAPASPVREYTDGDGRLCRVYARQVVIEGAAQTAYATVCREADGRWVLSR
jgi:surface antigen